MEKLEFRKWTTTALEDKFGLYQNFDSPTLNQWVQNHKEIVLSDFEIQSLLFHQSQLIKGIEGWNEQELREKFIGCIFSLVDFEQINYNYFAERELESTINDVILYGRVDALIAKGRREPKLPYFCLNQYKRDTDANGDVNGQTLAPMMAAQEINKHNFPVYGISIRGAVWRFLVLREKEYAVSRIFSADGEQLFDIFRNLKKLKEYIIEFVK
jgi:hypothetical protein